VKLEFTFECSCVGSPGMIRRRIIVIVVILMLAWELGGSSAVRALASLL
jgi:hypothetical protein